MIRITLTTFLGLLILSTPLLASAHASPVEYEPRSSSGQVEAPSGIRIRFSERLEPGASRIVVRDAQGVQLTTAEATVDQADPHILMLALPESGEGTFQVSWSVVSSDDGHFTRGGYSYFVGADIPAASSVPQVEVVQLSAIPEATTMFVELLGNCLLLGGLFVFALCVRRFVPTFTDEELRAAVRIYQGCIALGVILIVLGGAAHTLLKVSELAGLHSITFREALPLYIATVSGSATIGRAAVALVFGAIFFARRRIILEAKKLTATEIVLFLLLCIFAYLRAKVSHATANPFLPQLSVTVNFFHLIGKDVWAGGLALVSAFYVSRSLTRRVPDMLPTVFRLITGAAVVVAVTALYMVWLHLKSFSNITSTLWGERFIPLLVTAAIAVALLAYHVLAARFAPRLFARLLPYSLPAEVTVGIMIVFFSSLMIITSPPLTGGSGATYTERNEGVVIELSASPYEDGRILLTAKGSGLSEPTVFLGDGGEEATRIELEKRFTGGYVFPKQLLSEGNNVIAVTVQQEGGYDAHARFQVEGKTLSASESASRNLDLFTITMIVLAGLSLVFLAALYKFSPHSYQVHTRGSVVAWVIGAAGALLIASQILGLAQYTFGNRYKQECIANGNSWHLMLPTRNGVPISSVPQEGCMALGGSFHIPDAREYRYLKEDDASTVTFTNDLTNVSAGVSEVLSFSIMNDDGEPAVLSIAHERLVHAIVVSADMQEFWHMHPEARGEGRYTLPFTFPRSGTYLLALDYTQGLTPITKTYRVTVKGGKAQDIQPSTYAQPGQFGEYAVGLRYPLLLTGGPATFTYRIERNGVEVTDLAPYLGAAMHVAVVKNDLSEFIHTHGEVHSLNLQSQPTLANAKHSHAPPPAKFGPVIEAHVAFPTPGMYTLFGEFQHEGKVVPTAFTVIVE